MSMEAETDPSDNGLPGGFESEEETQIDERRRAMEVAALIVDHHRSCCKSAT